MPRARKKSNGNGNGTAPLQPMSKKMMKRKKPIDKSYMTEIKPLTDNQTLAFDEYKKGRIFCCTVLLVQVRHSLCFT